MKLLIFLLFLLSPICVYAENLYCPTAAEVEAKAKSSGGFVTILAGWGPV